MNNPVRRLIIKITENAERFHLHQMLGVGWKKNLSWISIHKSPSNDAVKQLINGGVFYAIIKDHLEGEVAFKGNIIAIYRKGFEQEEYQMICSNIWAYYKREDYPAILCIEKLEKLNKEQLINELDGIAYAKQSKDFKIATFLQSRRSNYLYLT